jgi:photosystem II stability/assembly factor-like uncharacterized protein
VRKYLAVRLAFLLLLPATTVHAQAWRVLGPPGGDVRSLASEPGNAQRLYLGTSDGHVFVSDDGAQHWRLLSRVGTPETVVFTLLVDHRDANVIYAGTWTLSGVGGGLFRSKDRGETWERAGLDGQTVRALAQAPSDPKLLLAGTLDGVYRSRDEGKRWQRISPEKHPDLLNFDSLAVDPNDADTIYAGTYHLAWRTADGGQSWQPIHAGMIDDSDVMSIVLDRTNPERVFATACSGMYRSENRGERWTRMQGIPFASRRTHFIQQDPQQPETFYAGTTQGLWKSTDGTLTWKRMTPATWSIIGLVSDVKRPGRLVVGLERRGIVVSEDGGATYREANSGFDHQQTFLFALDRTRPERMLLVLTNAADAVRATTDGGRTWRTLGGGLRPEMTRHVYAAPGEWLAAEDRGGLLRYDEKLGKWMSVGVLEAARPAAKPAKGPAKAKKAAAPKPAAFKARVHDMDFASAAWYAATDRGLFVSRDRGRTWAAFAVDGDGKSAVQAVRVASDGGHVHALTARGLMISRDAGKTWSRSALPDGMRGDILLNAAEETLVLAGDDGLFFSHDDGATWRAADIAARRISGFAAAGDVFLASTPTGLHVSRDRGRSWSRMTDAEAGGRFAFLERIGSTQMILAASATESIRTVEFPAAVSSRGEQPAATSAQARRAAESPRQQQ